MVQDHDSDQRLLLPLLQERELRVVQHYELVDVLDLLDWLLRSKRLYRRIELGR